MQKTNTTLVMMIAHPFLYPAITEVTSKAVLTSDGIRLSLTPLLFHIILKSLVMKRLQHKENLNFTAVHTQSLD